MEANIVFKTFFYLLPYRYLLVNLVLDPALEIPKTEAVLKGSALLTGTGTGTLVGNGTGTTLLSSMEGTYLLPAQV